MSATCEENLFCDQTSAGSLHLKAAIAQIGLRPHASHARLLVQTGAAALRGLRQACDILRGIHAGAGLIDHASVINFGSDLAAQFAFWNDAQLVVEFFPNLGRGLLISIE